MRAIVRDYSRPGDLVCDPCAGGGTTLLAAIMEGRRAIGSEIDPVTFEKAVKRLRDAEKQADLFKPRAPEMRQEALIK
jgi:DNA modification methylase